MRDRQQYSFAVPVKLLALLLSMLSVFLIRDTNLTYIPTMLALLYLAWQRNWRTFLGYGGFYAFLTMLLFLIRAYGLRMWIFSEFHVFLFWYLTPVGLVAWDLATTPPGLLSAFLSKVHAPKPIMLGLLVVFRFFPTMRTELSSLQRSMHNRGLTAASQVLAHPAATFSYMLVPMITRCLQVADQLAVSAVARGAEAPCRRESYFSRPLRMRDYACMAIYVLSTAAFLFVGGAK